MITPVGSTLVLMLHTNFMKELYDSNELIYNLISYKELLQ
jgi:hypothetical protein